MGALEVWARLAVQCCIELCTTFKKNLLNYLNTILSLLYHRLLSFISATFPSQMKQCEKKKDIVAIEVKQAE